MTLNLNLDAVRALAERTLRSAVVSNWLDGDIWLTDHDLARAVLAQLDERAERIAHEGTQAKLFDLGQQVAQAAIAERDRLAEDLRAGITLLRDDLAQAESNLTIARRAISDVRTPEMGKLRLANERLARELRDARDEIKRLKGSDE